jgi:hypothetical protein
MRKHFFKDESRECFIEVYTNNRSKIVVVYFAHRLFFAERLLEERIPLPCSNAELGCSTELVADAIRRHETEECPFGLLR